jgi:autotransporter-associated beta strand protein
VFLPSENEWYKAAYYNPATSSYFQYPTNSNAVPTAEAPPGGSDSANYGRVTGLTDVGAYSGTTSPYGAFDMGGNVFQWNEALIFDSDPSANYLVRGSRGGAFDVRDSSFGLLSSYRITGWGPSANVYDMGFRVASVLLLPCLTGTNSARWADSGNWSRPVPGAIGGTTNTDTAVFNQNAPYSPLTIDAGRNLQNITFDTASVNPLTIGAVDGQALLLTAGGTIQTTSTVINAQTVNAPLVLEGSYTFTSGAGSNSATLSFGGGITPGATSGVTTLTLDGGNTGTNTISGVLDDNGAGRLAVTKSGMGLWILSGANTYSGNTVVSGGTLKFNINLGTPTISAGATATVAAGATLELAGSVSALGSAGGNRTHILNNSTALGLLVSGTNQIVGGIDGTGNVQVNIGSDLSADHIVQNALIIAGAAGSPGRFTIAPSDSSGSPLGQSSAQPSGSLLAGSLASSEPFGAGIGSTSAISDSAGGSSNFVDTAFSDASSITTASPTPMPEPSTLVLAGCGLAIVAVVGVRRRQCRLQTNHLSLKTIN